MAPAIEVPVLIVGGGPVGLCSSILLSYHGVSSLLIEKHSGTSPYPKARVLNARTMEVFRQCGLEEAVRQVSLPPSSGYAI
jgi:putative polyketide hydroxylase